MVTNVEVADKKSQLMGRVIVFQKGAEDLEAYPEEGMKARVKGLRMTHDGDVVELVVDYTEFEDYNERFESANYYDDNGNPTLTARESGFYEQRETLYIDGWSLNWDKMFLVDENDEVTITLTQHELTQLRDYLNGRPVVDKAAVQAVAYRI